MHISSSVSVVLGVHGRQGAWQGVRARARGQARGAVHHQRARGLVPCDRARDLPRETSGNGRWYYASADVPRRIMEMFVARKQYIGQLELLAAVCVYYSVPADEWDGRHIVHFIDNTSALAGVSAEP